MREAPGHRGAMATSSGGLTSQQARSSTKRRAPAGWTCAKAEAQHHVTMASTATANGQLAGARQVETQNTLPRRERGDADAPGRPRGGGTTSCGHLAAANTRSMRVWRRWS